MQEYGCQELRDAGHDGVAMVKGRVMGRTLSEKVWDEHVVRSAPGEPDLL